ncbi:hypothetical protein [Cellulosilyticum ruminicola]|uniref:hypothetical protein n=1 Tax=Cellulosilyticum ruminicola TaxID=425254 RepID=UPI0012EE8622|nr:hypothetical protein [Cellulosilyticum ruminicola]
MLGKKIAFIILIYEEIKDEFTVQNQLQGIGNVIDHKVKIGVLKEEKRDIIECK